MPNNARPFGRGSWMVGVVKSQSIRLVTSGKIASLGGSGNLSRLIYGSRHSLLSVLACGSLRAVDAFRFGTAAGVLSVHEIPTADS